MRYIHGTQVLGELTLVGRTVLLHAMSSRDAEFRNTQPVNHTV